MLQEYIQPLVQYIHMHPHMAGLVTFLIVFGEALAVVGTIIPGSVTMTAIGTLIGSAVIPATSILIMAVAGAISGDCLSYWLGLHYQNRLYKLWPFKQNPEWLDKGERFFARHGGKSIILGRAIGPMRCLVPLVAGMLKMSTPRFLFAAVPSAAVWAIGYLLPGIMIGALSLELPHGMAMKFIVDVLSIVVILWLCFWLIQHFFKRGWRYTDKKINRLWIYCKKHSRYQIIPTLLTDAKEPNNHQQLTLVILATAAFAAFLCIMYGVLTHNSITALNVPLWHLLRSFHTDIINRIMLSITLFGNPKIMLLAGATILLPLLFLRNWRTALHLTAILILSGGTVWVFKHLFYSPRPFGLLQQLPTSSFPSGHTSITFCVVAFFAEIIARELKRNMRWLPYALATIAIISVAFSRLYLGAHWLTDVLGSIFLGFSCVLLVTISYRRKTIKKLSTSWFSTFVILTLFGVAIIHGVKQYPAAAEHATLIWPTPAIEYHSWATEINQAVPRYRNNRFGHPIEAFNVEYLGSLATLRDNLINQGWENHSTELNGKSLLHRLATHSTLHRLPLLPQLFHNRAPELLMTKDQNNDDPALIFRLWKSNIRLLNAKTTLWIGVIDFYHPPYKLLSLLHKKPKRNFIGATSDLSSYLFDFSLKSVTIPKEDQPVKMQHLHWDGQILLIATKNF